MFPTEKRTVSRREDGVEIAIAVISSPVTCCPLIGELIARAESWFEEQLVPRARHEYATDSSQNKRFFFRRFEYRLTLSLSPATEDLAELCIEATLDRRGGERMASTCEFYWVRLSDGAILPPHMAQKAKTRGA